jgi:hypothetical protein
MRRDNRQDCMNPNYGSKEETDEIMVVIKKKPLDRDTRGNRGLTGMETEKPGAQ